MGYADARILHIQTSAWLEGLRNREGQCHFIKRWQDSPSGAAAYASASKGVKEISERTEVASVGATKLAPGSIEWHLSCSTSAGTSHILQSQDMEDDFNAAAVIIPAAVARILFVGSTASAL